MAGWLIFLAMIFDALDGYVARLSKSASDFGAQLDSLADLVTFGVAPAILLVKISPAFTYLHREAIWVIAATFAVCAALRLARFNVETDETDDHMHFSGLALAGGGGLDRQLRHPVQHAAEGRQSLSLMPSSFASGLQFVLPFYALGVALLMVSRVPYPHLVNQVFRGRRSFNHIVSVVFALVAVMVIRSYSVPIMCCAFVLLRPGPLHLARADPAAAPQRSVGQDLGLFRHSTFVISPSRLAHTTRAKYKRRHVYHRVLAGKDRPVDRGGRPAHRSDDGPRRGHRHGPLAGQSRRARKNGPSFWRPGRRDQLGPHNESAQRALSPLRPERELLNVWATPNPRGNVFVVPPSGGSDFRAPTIPAEAGTTNNAEPA